MLFTLKMNFTISFLLQKTQKSSRKSNDTENLSNSNVKATTKTAKMSEFPRNEIKKKNNLMLVSSYQQTPNNNIIHHL